MNPEKSDPKNNQTTQSKLGRLSPKDRVSQEARNANNAGIIIDKEKGERQKELQNIGSTRRVGKMIEKLEGKTQSSKVLESEQSSQRSAPSHSTHTPPSTPTKKGSGTKIKKAMNKVFGL